ncbi:MAG TPA: biotin transporter BioY [Actinomycetota bacterium]|nr:biotin transporter BioY [Actinomycetota bacterium]
MTALAQAVTHRRAARSTVRTDVMLVVAGSLVMAGLAQISIQLPFTPVPVTGQTLGVLLVGGSLGALLGGASLLLYLAWGAIGLPFFAGGESGIDRLGFATASGGYLWGMVIAAVLIGYLAQKRWDRGVGSAIGAFLLGEIIIFTIGVLWLANALGIPVQASTACDMATGAGCDALQLGLYPFVIGDLLKVLLAAGAFPLLWKMLRRER